MDIRCVVCGEPWFSDLSDMAPWERDLFKSGAGCPCCKGQGDWQPETIGDIENGDGDPMDRLILTEIPKSERPEWKRPEPIVKWICKGCGIQAIEDPGADEYDPKDPALCWRAPNNGPTSAYHREWRMDRDHGDPEPEPDKVGDDPVCPECYGECDECGAPGFRDSTGIDVYDPGWLTEHPKDRGGYYVHPDLCCIDCLHEAEYNVARERWEQSNLQDRIDALHRAYGIGPDRTITIARLLSARHDTLPSDDCGEIVEYFNTP